MGKCVFTKDLMFTGPLMKEALLIVGVQQLIAVVDENRLLNLLPTGYSAFNPYEQILTFVETNFIADFIRTS